MWLVFCLALEDDRLRKRNSITQEAPGRSALIFLALDVGSQLLAPNPGSLAPTWLRVTSSLFLLLTMIRAMRATNVSQALWALAANLWLNAALLPQPFLFVRTGLWLWAWLASRPPTDHGRGPEREESSPRDN